jgi:hypothetical protein
MIARVVIESVHSTESRRRENGPLGDGPRAMVAWAPNLAAQTPNANATLLVIMARNLHR